ncbi:MAG: short-chain dehydrogenase/reductase [Bacteroidetes bacterium]|nr:MAG: short-chain dehydrogenase/reductase [Bacteroidota bacterium]
MMKKNWFITGISSGLGKALADAVIAKGDFLIGSFRKDEQTKLFNDQHQGKAFAYTLDVRDYKKVEKVIRDIESRIGQIDVLVNNAGYGILGAIEEVSLDEVREQMETNFFATLNITQLVLPLMRKRKSGSIIQMSSGSGIKSTPGFGIYNASKFALEGYSEALAAEVKPLGINVMLVEPGPFRTEFLAGSIYVAPKSISDYEATAGQFKRIMADRNGQQDGDPVKGARAIIQAIESPKPPLRLVLGKLAIGTVQAKIESLQEDLRNWNEVGMATSFE